MHEWTVISLSFGRGRQSPRRTGPGLSARFPCPVPVLVAAVCGYRVTVDETKSGADHIHIAVGAQGLRQIVLPSREMSPDRAPRICPAGLRTRPAGTPEAHSTGAPMSSAVDPVQRRLQLHLQRRAVAFSLFTAGKPRIVRQVASADQTAERRRTAPACWRRCSTDRRPCERFPDGAAVMFSLPIGDRRLPGHEVVGHLPPHRRQGRFQHRNVDKGALTRFVRVGPGRRRWQRPRSGHRSCRKPGSRRAAVQSRLISGDAHHSGIALDDLVIGRVARPAARPARSRRWRTGSGRPWPRAGSRSRGRAAP